jgi:hypothetical protein
VPKAEQKPTIVDHPNPSLKPLYASTKDAQPFNFLDELKKIEDREKELNSKAGKMSPEEMSKEYLEIHEQRKRLMERNQEEQKIARQTKTPGQDPNIKKDRGSSM